MKYFSFTFFLWLLGFGVTIVGLELSYILGYLDYIFINDKTYLSWLIVLVLAWQSLACGKEILTPDTDLDSKNHRLERGWFFSDIVLSLGMIGTVVGFMMMLTGFSNLDITSAESAQEMISQLGSGMATALCTTLIGLISSVLLKMQFFMLERYLEEEA